MAETSHIEWTDATWNPITGCSVVSPGCTNCYAMTLAGTRLREHPSRVGLTRVPKARGAEGGPPDRDKSKSPVWTGEVRLNEAWLTQPLRWRRPRMIFVCAHGDLFHEAVPDEWIDRVFAVMALCGSVGPGRSQARSAPLGGHTFQVLTKRSARMRAYLTDPYVSSRVAGAVMDLAPVGRTLENSIIVEPGRNPAMSMEWWPLPNVWLGVSVEDQQRADERIPDLLATPAAVRFVSAEPLLGPVDLFEYLEGREDHAGTGQCVGWRPPLDWVIVGGESGRGARPMHPDWARDLRDQCLAAQQEARSGEAATGTRRPAFFFKQWGEWGPGSVRMSTGEPVFRKFRDFQTWVNKAQTWVNGGICLDAKGRRCRIGADFMRARDEGVFPVTVIHRVGKKAAGALLDGREWREMPQEAPSRRRRAAAPQDEGTAEGRTGT